MQVQLPPGPPFDSLHSLMAKLSFSATIEIFNGNPFVYINAKRATALRSGWRKPLPVLIRINGKPKKPWRINMMPIGKGDFYLYLHGNVRRASKTKVGDKVLVEVEFDTDYRNGPMHPMPAKFRSALKENPAAKKGWNELIPSRKKEILRYLAMLKSPEAKDRNIAKAIHVLSGKGGRFMARSW